MQRSVRDILYVVFRYKWTIITVWAVIVAGTLAVTLKAKPIYRSESKLMIRLGRENVSLDPSVAGPVVGISQNRDAEVKSELAILMSEHVAREVVSAIGTDRFFGSGGWVLSDSNGTEGETATPEYKAARAIEKALAVVVAKDTNIINASFEAPDPQLAKEILAATIDAYLERHIELHASQASPTFFETQTEELRRALETNEKALEDFRKLNRIGSMERQIDIVLQEISELYLERFTGELENSPALATAAEARIRVLENALEDRPKNIEISRTTGLTNEAADQMKGMLIQLQLREDELSARYPDDHRPLVELREQMDKVATALTQEKETRTTVTTGVNDGYVNLTVALDKERASFEAHQARRNELADEILRKEKDLEALTQLQSQFKTLTRDVELAEQEYVQYRENLHRARISQALDLDKVSNVSVVQDASLPSNPVRPNKRLNLALGVALGLAVALGFAFFLDYLNDAIETDEQVMRRLDVPVLASISMKEFKRCT